MQFLPSISRAYVQGKPINQAWSPYRGLTAAWINLPGRGRGATWFDHMGANHGSLNGAIWSSGLGRPGGYASMFFDGSNDRIDLPVMNPTGSAYTIAAWVNVVDTGAIQHILCNDNQGGSAGRIFQFRMDAAGVIRLIAFTSGSTNGQAVGTTDLRSAGWKFVAGTWDGSNVRVYVDNTEEGNAVFSGTLSNSTSTAATIGDGLGGAAGFGPVSGRIDNVLHWYRALAASEINAVFQDTRRSNPAGLNRVRAIPISTPPPASTSAFDIFSSPVISAAA